MSEAQRLRDKAVHARELARMLADDHSKGALEALAQELDQQAAQLENQGGS
jgi:hypothetical protein